MCIVFKGIRGKRVYDLVVDMKVAVLNCILTDLLLL